jgi:hypothetical protein
MKEKLKAVFTKFEMGENWCEGLVGDFFFQAKSFDVGSDFGINGGRVSKLAIKRKSAPSTG